MVDRVLVVGGGSSGSPVPTSWPKRATGSPWSLRFRGGTVPPGWRPGCWPRSPRRIRRGGAHLLLLAGVAPGRTSPRAWSTTPGSTSAMTSPARSPWRWTRRTGPPSTSSWPTSTRWVRGPPPLGHGVPGAGALADPRAAWGIEVPGDHQVDNRALLGALVVACPAPGGDDRGLGGRAGPRSGGQPAAGRTVSGDCVLLAAGAATAAIGGLRRRAASDPAGQGPHRPAGRHRGGARPVPHRAGAGARPFDLPRPPTRRVHGGRGHHGGAGNGHRRSKPVPSTNCS